MDKPTMLQFPPVLRYAIIIRDKAIIYTLLQFPPVLRYAIILDKGISVAYKLQFPPVLRYAIIQLPVRAYLVGYSSPPFSGML